MAKVNPNKLVIAPATPFMRGLLKKTYFNTKKRAEFYRNIKNLIENGISIQFALKYYLRIMEENAVRDSELKTILKDLLYKMSEGIPFEVAIAFWVPPEEALLITASRQNIPDAVRITTRYADNMLTIQGAMFSALAYPMFMLAMLLAFIFGFSCSIIPKMTQISPVETWPSYAQVLYEFCMIVNHHIMLIVIGLGSIIFSMGYSLQRCVITWLRPILDKFPPWDIYKLYTSTVFLIATSALIKAGSSINHALKLMKASTTPYLSSYINKMQDKMTAGNQVSDAMQVGLFTGTILVQLAIFASTNKLISGIQYLADENLEEHKDALVKKGQFLGYILMALVAGIIGWFVLSLYGMQA